MDTVQSGSLFSLPLKVQTRESKIYGRRFGDGSASAVLVTFFVQDDNDYLSENRAFSEFF